MQQRLLLSILLTASFVSPAAATSYGLHAFADALHYCGVVVVAEVTEVIRVRPSKHGVKGPHRGVADISVRVLEHLKGRLPVEVNVTALDLGDPTTMRSPYKPLPENLVGRRLLLFLNRRAMDRSYEARYRFLVEADNVHHITFGDLRHKRYSLATIRAMVAQLNLIQAACPRNKRDVRSEKAAMAACRLALYSRYAPVAWYGARRLLDRQIPADFVPDLTPLVGRQGEVLPVTHLAVQCLAKIGDERAVPTLVEFLRRNQQNYHGACAVKALRASTHQDFGTDVHRWESWWQAHQKQRTEQRDEERPNPRVQTDAAVEDADDADAQEENSVE